MNIYITEQGSIIRKTGDRLIVEKEDEILIDIPFYKINAILIFGYVQVTTQAIRKMFEHNIELALLTRSGKLLGQITSPFTKNIELRIEQFKKYFDEEFKLKLARTIINGKLNNYLNFVQIFSSNHKEINFTEDVESLRIAIKKLESANTIEIDSLRGFEGIGTKSYFNCFRKMILGNFNFEGRKKHPSTDPVNALLSLGYTLIYNEISSLLDGLGFDPYLGYFHEISYGRASLACDIQEEFRIIADKLTLYLINNRMVTENDFYKNQADGSFFLKREFMKKYFLEYEKYINNEFKHPETFENTTLRKCFRIQAEKLANLIRYDTEYIPFRLND
jgi:CRISPR-associated protein Cas1